MGALQTPMLVEREELWRAGLDSDYPGMIAAVRQALLDLESGCASGAKATVAPRDEELKDLVEVEGSGLDLQSEDLDWKLSALVSVNRRHGAVKIVGANAFNRRLGLPRSRSTILLYDKLTMLPLAMLDGTDISAVRTGAYASLAAELFHAPGLTGTVVLFGAGKIAEAVIRCLNASHAGRISRIAVLARDPARVEEFLAPLRPLVSLELEAARSRAVLRHAELLITATTARHPVVEPGEIPPGIATLLLGGDELPAAYIEGVLEHGAVYCDSTASVAHRDVQSLALYFSRRGEDLTARQGIRTLGQEILNPVWQPGRSAHISCIGLPALDLYVTEYLYERLLAPARLPAAELRKVG